MKRKLFIILSTLVLIITLIFSFAFKDNKENNKEIAKVERLLSKPEGIQAYTLNGEKTNISFNELINGYTINKIACKNGTVATYNKTTNEVSLSNIKIPDYCTMDFKHSIYSKLLADNQTIKTRTDFSTTYTETNTGTLFKSTESIVGSTPKDVYYFAGSAQNNWVKFAGYYWRIIRTNHDGSVRLLYAGTSPDTTEGYIGKSTFNTESNSPKYVGYMYGENDSTLDGIRANTKDSTIKTYIDNWYSNNLSAYTKYLSTDAVYCNDRDPASGSSYSISPGFNYASFGRLTTNKTPTYNCTNIKDAFSASNADAKLTYPIGLMTADEIAYAGGKSSTNLPSPYAWYYLNSVGGSITESDWWWLLSPSFWADNKSIVFLVHGSGYPGHISNYYVNTSDGVRPVINLKGNLAWKSGDGSSGSPYEVEDLPPTLLTNDIKEKSITNEDGVYNENGYRYEGSDPSNYIYMTNKSTNEKELWRIIGVFNDGENGEEVIRVRRHYEKNSYPKMAYDTNDTNHFPNTTMYSALSSTYNLTNYSHTVNFKMFLGTSESFETLTSSGCYTAERGTTPGYTAANSYNNSVSFIGSVGLIYTSDYGYGVLSSDCARTIEPFNYKGTAQCYNNNWLFQGTSQTQWLISPFASNAYGAFYVLNRGNVLISPGVTGTLAYSPVMALSKDVLVSGSGTKTDPYMLVN